MIQNEHLGVCSVRIRHKGRLARWSFFVVPGDGPALLGILKITLEVVSGQQVGRKFTSQLTQPASILNYKTLNKKEYRSDILGSNQNNVNMLDYFRSSVNIEADKEVSRLIMQRIDNQFNKVFIGV